jgi:hypothetical protein
MASSLITKLLIQFWDLEGSVKFKFHKMSRFKNVLEEMWLMIEAWIQTPGLSKVLLEHIHAYLFILLLDCFSAIIAMLISYDGSRLAHKA